MREKMKETKFIQAAKACLKNGRHLLEDAEMLEFSEPPSSAFALSIIAQEEFAKGFLLALVAKGIIPWNNLIWRSTRDHTCKHLLGIIMDYLNPDLDGFFAKIEEHNKKLKEKEEILLPRRVADAINILRHEKIGRWESSNWFWDDPPDYDVEAKKVADGHIDKKKQKSLYVEVTKAGDIANSSEVTRDNVLYEIERAQRLDQLVCDVLEQKKPSPLDWERIESGFKAVFSDLLENKTAHNKSTYSNA